MLEWHDVYSKFNENSSHGLEISREEQTHGQRHVATCTEHVHKEPYMKRERFPSHTHSYCLTQIPT